MTKIAKIRALVLGGALLALVSYAQPVLLAQGTNLVQEVNAKKDKINWKNATDAAAIPPQVCTLLQVCSGVEKYATLPRATEGGQIVGRVMYQTKDSKQADVIVLSHQTPTERYYFLLSADGNLAKTGYASLSAGGSVNWVSMGNALAQPVFDKDKATWHAQIAKLGEAAAAPAAKKEEGPAAK